MSVRGATTGDYLPASEEFSGSNDPYTLIDRHTSVDGIFKSSRDIRIEGEAKGTIECQGTLIVAEGAVVSATVTAEHVTVAGELTGEISCSGRLQVLPSGRVRGSVATQSLVINEGAIYEGQLAMSSSAERPRQSKQSTGNAPVPIGAASESRGVQSSPTTFIRRMGGPETPWQGNDETRVDTEQAEAAVEKPDR